MQPVAVRRATGIRLQYTSVSPLSCPDYFHLVLQKKAAFTSDNTLMTNKQTAAVSGSGQCLRAKCSMLATGAVVAWGSRRAGYAPQSQVA